MKNLIFTLILILTFSAAYAQQDAKAQLKQVRQELAETKLLLEKFEEKYRKEVIKNAVVNGQIQGINSGIDKATAILQEAYNNEGKLDYQKLYDVGFRVVLDSTNTFKRPNKDKEQKK